MKIRDCFTVNPTGNTNKFTDYISYIDTASVNAGQLSNITYLDKDFPSRAQRLVKPNDILYSSVRPNLRHYYLYKDCYKHAVASTGFVLLRSKSKYNAKFAYYFLTTKEVVKHLSNIAELSQSTFPSFSPKDMGKIDLPDIDGERQSKIVSVLSAYDNLIEVNNKRIKVLEQMVENLYKEWFVRFRFPGHEDAEFEDGIPKGWRVGHLADIMSFGTGKTRPEGCGSYPVYGGNGILDYCNCYNSENAIIIGRVGAYCGSIYYEPEKCWISDNALYAKIERIGIHYCFYLLKSLQLNSRHIGTGQPLLTQSLLSKIRIIIPHVEMVQSFNTMVEPLIKQKFVICHQNENLIKQRDLLLPRLMSGKLEV